MLIHPYKHLTYQQVSFSCNYKLGVFWFGFSSTKYYDAVDSVSAGYKLDKIALSYTWFPPYLHD